MHKSIKKLLNIGGASLSPEAPVNSQLTNELLELLKMKNGFYAFESALHVFPDRSFGSEIGIIEWNNSCIADYKVDECLFFAEDIFGVQFCIKSNGIYSFNPETGISEFLSETIDGWAGMILADYECLTGYPLAHSWQEKHGAIASGIRLAPKTPFVAGGKYEIENLYEIESIKLMKLNARLALQVKELPDGESIILSSEMNPQEFVTELRKVVVDENSVIDRRLFSEMHFEEITDPYWKRAFVFFEALPLEQREVFFEILRQVAVDTTSNILGVIDGTCSIANLFVRFELIAYGENIAGDLQDMFLADEEELAEQRKHMSDT